MPADSADVLKRLNALSTPARRDLFAFLEISAVVPGQIDRDEGAYFEELFQLRQPQQKRAQA